MRRLIPAVVAALVHAALLAGFLTLRPKLAPAPPDEALPVVWLERKAAPPPPRAAPGMGLSLPAPALTITLPDLPIAVAPTDIPRSSLEAYVGCGLSQALTEEQRQRCDGMRTELYAKPGSQSRDYDLALEQRFSRDKAVQDLPLLRVCFRRMGPEPVCFVRGYEVLYGPTAARDSIPISIADPLRLR